MCRGPTLAGTAISFALPLVNVVVQMPAIFFWMVTV
jgi:hypothetical protein